MLKFVSWNVNGIRAVLKKGILDYIDKEAPDIFAVQETKASPDQLEEAILTHYQAHWNSAEKKGYSGTAVFTKIEPMNVTFNMPGHDDVREGRITTLEFKEYFLVNVYTPNSKRDLARLPYRQKWDADFLAYLKNLENKKSVIFCGDLNVAHTEIDLANPGSNHHNAGFTGEERRGFGKIIQADFVDTFRIFEPGPGHYTWWSYMNQSRQRNIGWRIDYFCVSRSIKSRVKKAFIRPDVHGSDHCPVGILFN